MFPGFPEHCNAGATLSENSRNIACRLGEFNSEERTLKFRVAEFYFKQNNLKLQDQIYPIKIF